MLLDSKKNSQNSRKHLILPKSGYNEEYNCAWGRTLCWDISVHLCTLARLSVSRCSRQWRCCEYQDTGIKTLTLVLHLVHIHNTREKESFWRRCAWRGSPGGKLYANLHLCTEWCSTLMVAKASNIFIYSLWLTSIEKKLVPVKLSPPFSMVASSLSQMKYALSPFRNLILEKTEQFFWRTIFTSILLYLSSTLISFEFSGGVGTTLHTTSSVHSVGCVEGPYGERNSFSKMVAEYRMEIIKRHKIWWIVNSSGHPLRDCALTFKAPSTHLTSILKFESLSRSAGITFSASFSHL